MSPTTDASLASLDGEIMPASEATVSATDEGFIRGDGVFEVIRLHNGRPFAMDEHLARLERSGGNLRLPVDLERVRAEAHRLLAEAAPRRPEALRIILTRGGRRVMLTETLPPTPPRIRLATVVYAPTRVLDGVKSLSYAANMLAGRLAREQGADEALFVSPHGRVLEGPTSSLFWVAGGEILTPPLTDHILASITRAFVLELAPAREQVCTVGDLLAADEAFLASTTRDAQPVASVDGHSLPGTNPVCDRLRDALRARIAADCR